ncbi:MAG: hypothetical protein ABEJ05_11610 [Haloglomus sp.]
MSIDTAAGDLTESDSRAVVLVQNGTADPRTTTVVVDGTETVTRRADLAPGEIGVVAAPVSGRVTASVHADDASASVSFGPETASAPPLFALRQGRVLVSPEEPAFRAGSPRLSGEEPPDVG